MTTKVLIVNFGPNVIAVTKEGHANTVFVHPKESMSTNVWLGSNLIVKEMALDEIKTIIERPLAPLEQWSL